MNDVITLVLGSLLSCDGQTFVSDITSSSQWSSVATLLVFLVKLKVGLNFFSTRFSRSSNPKYWFSRRFEWRTDFITKLSCLARTAS